MTSQKNSVQLDGLRPEARYVVQVRARTVAGYGQYSRPAEFETTSERGMYPTVSIPACLRLSVSPLTQSPPSRSPGSGTQQLQEQLPLIVGSATAGLVFVVAVVVIAVVCLRYSWAWLSAMGWRELPWNTLEPMCYRGPWWAQTLSSPHLSSPCPRPDPRQIPLGTKPTEPFAQRPRRDQVLPSAPCPSCEPKGPLNRGSCWACLRLPPHLPLQEAAARL